MSNDTIDQLKLAAVIAAFLFNWRAGLIAALFVASSLAFDFLLNFYTIEQVGSYYSAVMITLYCSAAVFIKFKSEIRQALWAIGAINWLAMVDYLLFPYETLFYISYPFIIHALDCYIIWHLISEGGRQDVGKLLGVAEDFILSVRCRILWLQSFYRQP